MKKLIGGVAGAFALGSFLLFAQAPPAPQRGGAQAPPQPMSFFVTSAGSGDGANLGGLAGADRLCNDRATAAGSTGKTWRAYLSAAAASGQPAVNARDRIGAGPWYNSRGGRIAQNLAELHGDTLDLARMGNNFNKTTSLTEKSEVVPGAGDTPNQHDVLTGSRPDGTAFTDGMDHTCNNWTSNAATGSAQVGHSDRTGGNNNSWNSAHGSRGCGQANLVATGGAGRIYCFAN